MTKLVDGFGRRIEYLRLSVTDRCDLRCSYCMPADHHDFSEPDHWLTFDETEQIVSLPTWGCTICVLPVASR
jgi:cyclic pyranopterin phosphate synthase